MCWMRLQEKQKLTAEKQQLLKQILNYSYEVRTLLYCTAGVLSHACMCASKGTLLQHPVH